MATKVTEAPDSDLSGDEYFAIVDPASPTGARVRKLSIANLAGYVQSLLTANVMPRNLIVDSLTFTPQSNVPASLQAGTMYFDVASGGLKVFDGTNAVPISTGAGTPVTPGGGTGGTGDTGGTPSPTAPKSITLSSANVLENSPQGFVIGTLAADQSGCTFSIVGGATTFFQIAGAQLQCSGIYLDYEAAHTRDVTIRATNGANLTFDKIFTITVQDVIEDNSTPLLGKQDAPGPYENINLDMPTVSNTGNRVSSLTPWTQITTNSAANVYRSGDTVILQGTNPVLEGYDFRMDGVSMGRVEPRSPNWTIRDCLFGPAGYVTIEVKTANAYGGTIEYNTFDGMKANNSHTTFFNSYVHIDHKRISYNKWINTPTDCITFDGAVSEIYFNFVRGMGYQTGAHPDFITANGGVPNQKRTVIGYNYIDLIGIDYDIEYQNAQIKIADGTSLRSNFLIMHNIYRGAAVQNQIADTLVSKIEFLDNWHYLIGGPPVYSGDYPVVNGRYGPFNAYYPGVYGSADIFITGAKEARTGGRAQTLNDFKQAVVGSFVDKAIPAGIPNKVSIASVDSAGNITVQSMTDAATYEYMVAVSGTVQLTDPQALSVTGSGTLSGKVALVPNAWNNVYVRGVNASGKPGPWSTYYQVASGVAAAPAAPGITGVPTIAGVPTVGQTLTATAAPMTGNPAAVPTYLWQRDTAGNGTPIDLTDTGLTHVIPSGEATHRLRIKQTGTNGVGSPAVAYSAWTSAVAAAAASTIGFVSRGTLGVSTVGDGSATKTATAGAPSGVTPGARLLRWVHCSDPASIVMQSGWTLVVKTDWFGVCGGALYTRIADGSSADTPTTISVPNLRAGDYLSDLVECYAGGSGAIDAFNVSNAGVDAATTYATGSIASKGANRLPVIGWFTEDTATNRSAVTGTAGTGFTETFEQSQSAAGTYKQCLAIDRGNALVGDGAVVTETRTFSAAPGAVSAITVLLY